MQIPRAASANRRVGGAAPARCLSGRGGRGERGGGLKKKDGGKFKRLPRVLQVVVGAAAGAVPPGAPALPRPGRQPPQPGPLRGRVPLRLQARRGGGVLPGEVAGLPGDGQHVGAAQAPALPRAAQAAAPGPGAGAGGAGAARPPGAARPRRRLPGAEGGAAAGAAALGAAPQRRAAPPGPHRRGERGGPARPAGRLRLRQRVQGGRRRQPQPRGRRLRVPRLPGRGGGRLLPRRLPQQVRLQRGRASAHPGRAAHLRVQLAVPLRRRLPQPRGAEGHPLRPLHLPHGQRPRLGRPHPRAHPQELLRHGVRGRDHHVGGGGAAGAGLRPAGSHLPLRPRLRGGRLHRGRRPLRQHLPLRQPQLRPQPAGLQRLHRQPGRAAAAHRPVRHPPHPRRRGAHLRLQHARGPGGRREHPHGLQLRAGRGPGRLPPRPGPHRVQVRGRRLPQVPLLGAPAPPGPPPKHALFGNGGLRAWRLGVLPAPHDDGAGGVAGGQQALVAVEGHGQHRPAVAPQRVEGGARGPRHVEEVHARVLAARHCVAVATAGGKGAGPEGLPRGTLGYIPPRCPKAPWDTSPSPMHASLLPVTASPWQRGEEKGGA